jgi:hypothetical protein
LPDREYSSQAEPASRRAANAIVPMTAIRPYRPYSAPHLCAHYHRLSRGDHRQSTAGQDDRLDIYRPWMLLLWAVFRPFSAAT